MSLSKLHIRPGFAGTFGIIIGVIIVATLGATIASVGGGGSRSQPSLFSSPYETACAYSLGSENSLDADKLKQVMNEAHMGLFAKNEHIFKGIIEASQKYGISNVYIASHASLESNYGNSAIAKQKKNLFGYGALDRSPGESANAFETYEKGINFVMEKVENNYLKEGGKYYVDEEKISSLEPSKQRKADEIKRINRLAKIIGATTPAMNVYYASDTAWAKKINEIMKNVFGRAKIEGKFAGGCQVLLTNEEDARGEKNKGRGITTLPNPETPSLVVDEKKRLRYRDRGTITPEAIVLHYSAGDSFENLIATLESRNPPNGLACHIGIDVDGTTYQIMDSLEEKSACAPGMNTKAIQLEIVGANEQALLKNKRQQDSVIGLIKDLIEKYHIKPIVFASSKELTQREIAQVNEGKGIYSHSVVDKYLAGSRKKGKIDPGDTYMGIIKKAIK